MTTFIKDSFPEALTKEETVKYCKLAKEGNVDAKNKLVKHNLRLVAYRIRQRFNNANIEFEDLVSIGAIGLIKAVESFDIDKTASFPTYATVCIDNEILMSFRNQKKNTKNVSMDEPINHSGDLMDKNSTLADLLYSDEDFVEDIVIRETYNDIRESLNVLNDLERKVIEMYYGFNCQPMNQTEIAKIVEFEQSYISRVLRIARGKIKIYMETIESGKRLDKNSKILQKKRIIKK